jgi:urease accessory protein
LIALSGHADLGEAKVSDWLTWQIVDSAFPTGTFAHSWGLEAAWQQGEVGDLAALRAFLDRSIRQTAHASVPLVNAAYHAPERLEELDGLAEAFLINAVANYASRVQGRTLLGTVARIWPCAAIDDVQARSVTTRAHVAPITGAAFRAIGVPLTTVQRVVLYGAARGVLSAAVRLGIAGSYEAQRVLFECGPSLERTAAACADWSDDDLAQTEPLIDLLQAAHARLYSRLFQS